MEWYQYSPETFEYTNPVICQPNPAQPGKYLVPPNATQEAPPATGSNEVAVFSALSNVWEVEDDYRGHQYYLSDGSQHEISEIGETPPDDALDTPPPPSEEEIYASLVNQRNRYLAATDWLIQRTNDQLLIGAPADLQYSDFLEVQHWRQELRDLPEQYPTSEEWVWPDVPDGLSDLLPTD